MSVNGRKQKEGNNEGRKQKKKGNKRGRGGNWERGGGRDQARKAG